MNATCPELTTKETATAYDLWETLILARTDPDMDAFQQELTQAVPHVRQAIISAVTQALEQQTGTAPDENPFN